VSKEGKNEGSQVVKSVAQSAPSSRKSGNLKEGKGKRKKSDFRKKKNVVEGEGPATPSTVSSQKRERSEHSSPGKKLHRKRRKATAINTEGDTSAALEIMEEGAFDVESNPSDGENSSKPTMELPGAFEEGSSNLLMEAPIASDVQPLAAVSPVPKSKKPLGVVSPSLKSKKLLAVGLPLPKSKKPRSKNEPKLKVRSTKIAVTDIVLPDEKNIQGGKAASEALAPFYPYGRDQEFQILVKQIIEPFSTMVYRGLTRKHVQDIVTRMIKDLMQDPEVAQLVPFLGEEEGCAFLRENEVSLDTFKKLILQLKVFAISGQHSSAAAKVIIQREEAGDD
jgi:hypothetical protein